MRNTHQHTYPPHSSRRKSRCPFHFPFITLICAGTLNASADFTPYAVIIERAIFGRPPVRVDKPAAAVDAAEQRAAEALARKITMCAVNRTPSGHTAVGLIDNETKPPRNFYLNVGETESGITILAADYDAETAVIEKDGITITLQLGKGLIGIGTEAAAEHMAAAMRPANAVADPDATAEKRPRAFKTPTEQLLSMVMSGPPGSSVPPLPVSDDADLSDDFARALDNTILIYDDDSDDTATHKENVGWAKVGMQEHVAEGGDAVSYIKLLEQRRNEEAERQRQARADAEARLAELAREISAQELAKQRAEINQWLIDNQIEPLDVEE